MSDFVLISDSRVVSIPIIESDEPMMDLRSQNEIIFGPSPEIENNTCYTSLRQGVYERLIHAQRELPSGIRFCVYEGLRTLALQETLFNMRREKVIQNNPHWNQSEIFHEVTKMVAPVINLDGTQNVPPHSTGAAVDLYLVDLSGKPLEMGIQVKDWILDLDGKLSQTDSELISPEAKKNRDTLARVMSKAGFVNMPTEYWHWSFGDRYWAFIFKKPHAVYGPVKSL